MSNQLFVNLAVKNLNKAIEYFTKLGYTFNPQFTDETATCMKLNENTFFMLLTEEKFKSFTPKSICDTSKSVEAFLAVSFDSKQAVIDIVEKALAAGGTIADEPEDLGFMYSTAVEDLDGHTWNYFCMDMAAFEKMQCGEKLQTANS